MTRRETLLLGLCAWLLGSSLAAALPAHPTATGRLRSYDARTRTLTLQRASGQAVYHVASGARLWLGRRTLPAEALARHLGAQVTLAYSEQGGRLVTHTLRLVDAPHAREERDR